jgi:glutathione peroxidase
MSSIYDFEVETAKGQLQSLKDFSGKVLLIVNTALDCGFADQLKALQTLQDKYQDQGFCVLAFPSSQFAGQNPQDSETTAQVCQIEFGATYPVFAKTLVNGKEANPLFQFLKKTCPGVLGSEAIKWNFTKFLINREGMPVERFAPALSPLKLKSKIEALL